MRMILWPAVITLGITLLRLIGELQGWDSSAFRTLLGYALAARIPVAIVMLFAIFGKWGTHYDVLPPNPPERLLNAGPFEVWLWIGLRPQMTIWIAQTVLLGAIFGGIAAAVAKPKTS